jgi:hypothetical protein
MRADTGFGEVTFLDFQLAVDNRFLGGGGSAVQLSAGPIILSYYR